MPYYMPDTDVSDLLVAIQAVIESQPTHQVIQRIPVWFQGRIVAWYTVQIQREEVGSG